jgi:hypothetical protein
MFTNLKSSLIYDLATLPKKILAEKERTNNLNLKALECYSKINKGIDVSSTTVLLELYLSQLEDHEMSDILYSKVYHNAVRHCSAS